MNNEERKDEGMSIKVGGFTLKHLGMVGAGVLIIGIGIYILNKIK